MGYIYAPMHAPSIHEVDEEPGEWTTYAYSTVEGEETQDCMVYATPEEAVDADRAEAMAAKARFRAL